jgi:hypothetical protein
MSGAIPPLPRYIFMAWCLVKCMGITLTFYLSSAPEAKELFPTFICKISRMNSRSLAFQLRVYSLLYDLCVVT